jgi:hypothetical protein
MLENKFYWKAGQRSIVPILGVYMGGWENLDVPVSLFKENVDVPVSLFKQDMAS